MQRYHGVQRLISKKGFATDLSFTEGEAVNLSSGDFIPPRSHTASIYVGGSGAIVVEMIDGTILTFNRVVSGTFIPICVKRILQSGTTATDLIILT